MTNEDVVNMTNTTKDGWHTVYDARVYVENGRSGGYTRLNLDEWKGMKFATFRSGMAKGVYLIQRY